MEVNVRAFLKQVALTAAVFACGVSSDALAQKGAKTDEQVKEATKDQKFVAMTPEDWESFFLGINDVVSPSSGTKPVWQRLPGSCDQYFACSDDKNTVWCGATVNGKPRLVKMRGDNSTHPTITVTDAVSGTRKSWQSSTSRNAALATYGYYDGTAGCNNRPVGP